MGGRLAGTRRMAAGLLAGAVGVDLTLSGALAVTGQSTLGHAEVAGNLTQSNTGRISLRDGATGDLPLRFADDTNNGMFRNAADDVRWVAGGGGVMSWRPTVIENMVDATFGALVTATGRVTGAGFTSSIKGTVALPSYNWTDDTDCGPYLSTVANRWELAAGGADALSVRSSLLHLYLATTTTSHITMGTGAKLILDTSTSTSDLALQFNGDPNLGFHRDSADHMRAFANGSAVHSFYASSSAALGNFFAVNAATFSEHVIITKYLELIEMAAPAAPAADRARVFAVVDGGGKTDLSSHFQSGAALVFTQEA